MLKSLLNILIAISAILLLPSADSRAEPGTSKAKVTILVASWCVHCFELEKFLNENSIGYLKLDVERDPDGKRIYHELGGGGVPLVIIGNTVMRGFYREEILELLQKYGSLPAKPVQRF